MYRYSNFWCGVVYQRIYLINGVCNRVSACDPFCFPCPAPEVIALGPKRRPGGGARHHFDLATHLRDSDWLDCVAGGPATMSGRHTFLN